MRIFLTGATSGIGLVAARHLAKEGHQLVLGARSALPPDLEGHEQIPLDLADLGSVSACVERLKSGPPVDVLVLNAGVQDMSSGRSAQDLDLTFAVNHLAHYYLARRLATDLRRHGRVIFTASGTHDPAERTGLPPPRHADAFRLARPWTDPGLDAKRGDRGRRAYTSSKLCNIMTARELSRRLQAERPDIAVAAFDPAFTPGTGLARDYPFPVDLLFRLVLPLLVHGDGVSRPGISGLALARLAASEDYGGARGGYFAVRGGKMVEATPSALARDAVASSALWGDSQRLLAEIGFPIDL